MHCRFGETGRKLSEGRTSSNSWCRTNCLDNPHVQSLMGKIEEIIRVPRENYENFQVLRYQTGQRYNVHHDMSEYVVYLHRSCTTSIQPPSIPRAGDNLGWPQVRGSSPSSSISPMWRKEARHLSHSLGFQVRLGLSSIFINDCMFANCDGSEATERQGGALAECVG